ncbi:MAG: MFS transporter [Verrucomicrobiota bacterium]
MKLSIQEKVGYGLGDTASNLVWATLVSFIMIYYTDVFGISAAAAGSLFLFARAFDGVTDFAMGAIADRTRSRWGKFRPYLLWMCLPLAGVTVLTFTVPDFDPTGKLLYAWVTYNLLMAVYTAINIPYSALSGVMTDDTMERTGLNSWRMVLAQAGGFIVNGATLPLVQHFGKGDAAHGYQLTAALFGMIAVCLFLICFATTRERVQPPPGSSNPLIQDIRALFSDIHWRIIFLVGLLDLTFIIIRAGSLLYHARYVLALDESRTTLYLLLGNIGFILGAALTRPVTASFGKKRVFIAAHVLMALSAGVVFWLPPSLLGWIFALQFLHAFAAGWNAVLFFSMIADTADHLEWKAHTRATGLVFSATTCAQKIGMGIGGAVAGLILTRSGYVANAIQSPAASHGILLLVSLIPAIGFLLVAMLLLRYSLTESICRHIREDLAARRTA